MRKSLEASQAHAAVSLLFAVGERPSASDIEQLLAADSLSGKGARISHRPAEAEGWLERIGFDDFRHNGLLLPANDDAALRFGLPLYRGPHRTYNAVVIERVGQIELGWSTTRLRAPDAALNEALMRLSLLQRALRRRLLVPLRRRFALNRRDPLVKSLDFSELDAMADALWRDCGKVQAEMPSLAASSRCAS